MARSFHRSKNSFLQAMGLLLGVLLLFGNVQGQEEKTIFGIQFKPIVPWSLVRTGPIVEVQNGVEYTMEQRLGYSFGMVVRKSFKKYFSVETGISAIQRNYRASILYDADGFTAASDFRVIGYEIPTLGQVYIKLDDKIYMNTAFGGSIDMFPSNVGSSDSTNFTQWTVRQSWIQLSLLANVGWEYRTERSGYIYLGASYHRPFSPTFTSKLEYRTTSLIEERFMKLRGDYLTIDFRYFFHEDEEKRQQKKKKIKKKNRSLWNQ